MAKKIGVSARDAQAANDALNKLESLEGQRVGATTAEDLRERLWRLRNLLKKAAGPRVSKPLRVH